MLFIVNTMAAACTTVHAQSARVSLQNMTVTTPFSLKVSLPSALPVGVGSLWEVTRKTGQ